MPKDERNVQVAIRIPAGWIKEADRLARARSQPGLTVTRTDVLRVAMGEGLENLRGRK